MDRFVIGAAIPIIGTLVAFTMNGGKLVTLLHVSELLTVISFTVGGMIIAYGGADIREMLRGALDMSKDHSPERLRRNVLVCEGASKLALFGGFVACFLGIVITMGAIAGDVSVVAEKFGAALTGLVLGAGMAGVFFQPLKFKFLNLLNEVSEQKTKSAPEAHEEALS